jgi:phosphatidylserine/phosphatidylglycerophosphate/cardiolipin synthase-like enzyme
MDAGGGAPAGRARAPGGVASEDGGSVDDVLRSARADESGPLPDKGNPPGHLQQERGTRAVQATQLDERQQRLRRTLEVLTGTAFTEGNELTVLRNGDRIFPAMLEAIEKAERTVDFVTFVYWKGEIARHFAYTLADAASRGVRVRVLIDALGGRLIDSDLVARMADSGVHVEWFRKPWLNSPLKQNHRCHRKVLVCDEEVGFTGGVGIAEEWCGDARNEDEWRDTTCASSARRSTGCPAPSPRTGRRPVTSSTTSSTSSRSTSNAATPSSRSSAGRPASAGTTCSRPSA